jgi:hypothetical protein
MIKSPEAILYVLLSSNNLRNVYQFRKYFFCVLSENGNKTSFSRYHLCCVNVLGYYHYGFNIKTEDSLCVGVLCGVKALTPPATLLATPAFRTIAPAILIQRIKRSGKDAPVD